MRAGNWGDRQAERPPYYVKINNRVVTPAEFERTKRELMAGWVAVPSEPDTRIDWENVAAQACVIFLCVCGLLWFFDTFLR